MNEVRKFSARALHVHPLPRARGSRESPVQRDQNRQRDAQTSPHRPRCGACDGALATRDEPLREDLPYQNPTTRGRGLPLTRSVPSPLHRKPGKLSFGLAKTRKRAYFQHQWVPNFPYLLHQAPGEHSAPQRRGQVRMLKHSSVRSVPGSRAPYVVPGTTPRQTAFVYYVYDQGRPRKGT